MKCPSDVRKEDFEDMIRSAPDGARLLKSERASHPIYGRVWWRDFVFLLTKPLTGKHKQGDIYRRTLPCKFGK